MARETQGCVRRFMLVCLLMFALGATVGQAQNARMRWAAPFGGRRKSRSQGGRSSETASFVDEEVASNVSTTWAKVCEWAAWLSGYTLLKNMGAWAWPRSTVPCTHDDAATQEPQPEMHTTPPPPPAAPETKTGIKSTIAKCSMFLKKLRPSRNLFSMFCTTAAPKATTSQEGEAAGAKSEGDSPKSKPNALSWIKKNLTFTKNKATSAAPETSQESESQGNNVAGPEPKPGCWANLWSKCNSLKTSITFMKKKTVAAPAPEMLNTQMSAQAASADPMDTTEETKPKHKPGFFSFLGRMKLGSRKASPGTNGTTQTKETDSQASSDKKTLTQHWESFGAKTKTFFAGLKRSKNKSSDNTTSSAQSNSASPRTSAAGSHNINNAFPENSFQEPLVGSSTSPSSTRTTSAGDTTNDASGVSGASGDATHGNGRGSASTSSGGSSLTTTTKERSLADRAWHKTCKRSSKALRVTKEAAQGALEDIGSAFDKMASSTADLTNAATLSCKTAAKSINNSIHKFGAAVVVVGSWRAGSAPKATLVTPNLVNIHVTSG